MKIIDILNNKKLCISFEVFPPKPQMPMEPVIYGVDKLAEYMPDYISVTYGAAGSNSKRTTEIASHIQNDLNVNALAHLTCVASSKNEVDTAVLVLKKHQIENILALRGDIPDGMDFPEPRHYEYASQLIAEIKARGDFCIGGACYPEGHPECENREDDIDHLKEKVEAGCDFLVSQLFFDNDVMYNFLYRLFKKNINVPVIAGIMPVTNSRQIRRMTQLSGASLTPKFRSMVDRFEHSPKAIFEAGIAYATDQIIDLISNGVKGIHIYTMNKPEIAGAIIKNISSILEA